MAMPMNQPTEYALQQAIRASVRVLAMQPEDIQALTGIDARWIKQERDRIHFGAEECHHKVRNIHYPIQTEPTTVRFLLEDEDPTQWIAIEVRICPVCGRHWF